jgi:putative membrane protein
MLQRFKVLTLGVALAASIGLQGSVEAQDPPRPAEPRQDTIAPSPDRTGPQFNDANIIAIMDAASGAEIESSQLAEKQGASKEIRSLAERMRRDHGKMQQELRDLAKQLNITPAPPSKDPYAEEHRELMEKLNSKTGTDFDREFVGEQIEMHQELLADLTKKFIPSVQSQDLRAHLESVTPSIQAHLDLLRTTQKQIAAR